MTGPHISRRWAAILWGLCLLAGAFAGPPDGPSPARPSSLAAAAVVADPLDAALLPASITGETRVAAQSAGSARALAPVVLAVILGLAASRRRSRREPATDHLPLHARRHTIALRAPPLRLA